MYDDWRAGASQPSRFNGRFFSLYIYLYIYIFIYFGRWTPPYRNVLRDSKYAHKCEISKKQHKTPRVRSSVVRDGCSAA